MVKIKFTREYALNASSRMLYPYLSSASGLEQWFCQSARVAGDRRFIFLWDNQEHYAEMTNYRTNKSVRFTFTDSKFILAPETNYIEFSIESSELTQEQFLRVTDYTDVGDTEQLEELWDNLILNLKEIIGG